MISSHHILRYGVLSFLCFVFILSGSACAGKTGDDNGNADWHRYSNAESRFTFQYPPDWEVVHDGFYKTAYVVTIQKVGGSEDSNNWIRINPPQFMEEYGKCIEVDSQQICTYSKDAKVLDIFQGVVASFKLEPA